MAERKFKDKHGVEFDMTLDLGLARKIDDADWTNLDGDLSIVNPDESMLKNVGASPSSLAAFAFLVCEDQFLEVLAYRAAELEKNEARGIALEMELNRVHAAINDSEARQLAFLRRLDGPSKMSLQRAFYEALADFFPESRTVYLECLSLVEEKDRKVRQRMDQEVPALMKEASRQMDEYLDQGIAEIHKKLKGGIGAMSGT